MNDDQPVVYFNNCRARDHVKLYGAGAFYDLNVTGRQGRMATNIEPGDTCVVATLAQDGDIEFIWYCFSHVEIMADENGADGRVFFGKRLKSEALSKAAAAQTEPYAVFFDVNGHFKRPAAIEPRRRRPLSLVQPG